MVCTSNFNVSPYYDDFDPEKKFLRHLFRPGYAVQARELTQIQTILQNQIDRFGSHIFEDGSKVIAADIADQNIKFLRVEKQYSSVDLVPEDFIGYEISSDVDTDLKAFVFHAIEALGDPGSGDDPYVILFIEYTSTGTDSEFQTTDVLTSANTITLTKATVKDSSVDPLMDVTGDCILASIDEGIFFVGGFFVLNDAQRVAPFRPAVAADAPIPLNVRLFSGINARVGFDISKDIVTSDDDTSLLDPAFGSPNFNAPGADRFRIRLLINFRLFADTANTPQDFSDEDFVEWMRIRRDIVVLQAVRPDYSALENELAERVEAIHGSFTVRAFSQDVRPHLKNDLYVLTVSAQVGTFQVGEQVTGGVSGAVGVVDFITDFDISFLMQSGVFVTTETITGGTSTATATVDTIDFQEDVKGVFSLAQGGEEESIAFGLEPGKAFVQGFEFETLATEYVKVDKARDTSEVLNYNVSTSFGNYILVDSANNTPPPTDGFEDWNTTLDINDVPIVDLYDGDSPAVQIGTARIRQILQDTSGVHRIYLFDSVFDAGKSISDVVELRDGGTVLWFIADGVAGRNSGGTDPNVFNRLGQPATILFEADNNKLVFPVPVGQSTEKFDESDWRSQQQFSVFLNASGIGSVATTSPTIRFVGGTPTLVAPGDLIHYTVINRANGDIVDMSLPGNSVVTNNNLPASNGQVTLTVADGDGLGNPITSTTVTLIATLDINDDNVSNEPLIRRNKVLQKDQAFASINLEGEVVLGSDLSDTLTDTETITVTGPVPVPSTTATVNFTNDSLTALIKFSFAAGGLGGAFVAGETATGTSAEVAIINGDVLIVDAYLTSVSASFIPGEVLYEGASPATAVALAVAITPTQFRITFGMFTQGGTINGVTSGATADIEMDPILGNPRSTFTAAIFDYNASTTTGVLVNGDTVVTGTSANTILIDEVINYRGKILTNVIGDFTERTLTANDTILGGTSSATATVESVVLTGTVPVADLFGVVAIEDQGNGNLDVTPAFFVDDGQRDNLYDYATIEYDDRSGVPLAGPFRVRANYFQHQGDGPLYVNSYTHTSPGSNLRFENIPLYTSPQSGNTVALRDVVDFRPIRTGTTTIGKVFMPKNGEAFDADYSYHLPRIDKIILRKELRFDVLRGIPSLEAETPADDPEALTLFIVKIPPYTYNVEDVETRYIENKRYSMSDIGDIDKRVERLEYYTSLTLLERETEALAVTDATGQDRFKNGIVVDSFQGHNVGDVLNPDYDIAVDFENRELRPPFIDRPVELELLPSTDQFVTISSDGIVTLAYTESALVFQPLASTAISVNPFNVVNWMGSMEITPSSDTWIDVEQRPELRVNLEGENDGWAAVTRAANGALPNGFGTQWGSWEQNWTGRTVRRRRFQRTSRRAISAPHASRAPDGLMRRKVEETTATIERTVEVLRGRETRTGIRTRVVPERIERTLGNRVVDVSIIQFIRPRDGASGNQPPLRIDAAGMKPNTRVYPFFDDVEVSAFCRPNAGSLGDPIVTDSSGAVANLEFELPASRFRTGDRLFRLTDEASNIIANALTTSEQTWNAQGLLQTREEAIVSTRVPVLRRQSVTQNRPARDVRTRDRTVRSQTRVRWIDPLAQTFLVDSNLHPNGVFLTSVDLFFKAVPTASNVPVTIQIRPVVNGFPHSSAIVPFSEVSLDPGSVTTTDAPDPATNATTFQFTSPVHLSGGQEYALVILSNSDEYLTYIATIGANQLGTEDRISAQPYAGSLFRSQNASTWTPDQTSDLMFALNRAVFDTVNTGTLDYRNTLTVPVVPVSLPDEAGVNELYLLSSQLEFPDSELNLSVDISDTGVLPSGQFIPILANQREKFVRKNKILMTTNPESFILRAQFISNDDAISPVLDQDRLTAIVIENRVNDSLNTTLQDPNYNGELEPKAFVPKDPDIVSDPNTGAMARYVTRLVTLQPGFESTDVRVFLTANKQLATEIQVFVRVQTPEAEGDFNNERYVQLQPTQSVISENDDDFREVEYELPTEFAEPFNKFVVKVVLYSLDKGVTVPRVRDLRAIAVI